METVHSETTGENGTTNDSNDGRRDDTGHVDAPIVGPTVDLADVAFPESVATQFQTLYGTDEPPRDAAAWIEATREEVEVDGDGDGGPTVADLCTTVDGDHRFTPSGSGDSQEYVCVLDPLAYPFITGTPGRIRSQTQGRGETITVDVAADGVAVSHPDSVLSLGVSDHVESGAVLRPAIIYRQVCGYVHVFADREEYETWAADVEAATTAVGLETGIGLAKSVADALFD